MAETVVEGLYGEYSSILTTLEGAEEWSLKVAADGSLRKALLLAAASYFEAQLSGHVLAYVAAASGGSAPVVALVRAKAVTRQYHTWFTWDCNNANTFFSLFGPEFSEFMKARVAASDDLGAAIKAFLQLGLERNLLVHKDFGAYPLEKTTQEVYESFLIAKQFVDDFPSALNEFTSPVPTVDG
jgi:hypothetical protein